jgi:hypothetical protein
MAWRYYLSARTVERTITIFILFSNIGKKVVARLACEAGQKRKVQTTVYSDLRYEEEENS